MLHWLLALGISVHLVIQHPDHVQSIVAPNVIVCLQVLKARYWRQLIQETVNGWRVVIVYVFAVDHYCIS